MSFYTFDGYGSSIAIIAIMISMAGILLGLGYAADDRRLKDFGREELYQSLINGVMVGTLIIAFGEGGIVTLLINSVVEGTSPQVCVGALGSNAAICFAYYYLMASAVVSVNGHLYPSLISSTALLFGTVSALYVAVGTLSSIKVTIAAITVGLQGLNVFLGPLNDISEFLAFSALSIASQAALLKFIAATIVPVLLPIGLLLRTFYPTRRLGGTILAISIGLFVVLPMTYVFDAQLLNTFSGGVENQTVSSAVDQASGAISAASNIEGMPSVSGTSANSLNPVSAVYTAVEGLVGLIGSSINSIIDAIAMLIIQTVFLPVLSLVLTAVSTRELARLLGSEVSLGRFDVF